MFCTKCGNEVKDSDLFCSRCGARMRSETEVSSVSADLERSTASLSAAGLVGERKSDCGVSSVKTDLNGETRPSSEANPKEVKRRIVGFKTGLRLPQKRVIRLSLKKKSSPEPLAVNGLCRYCGTRLNASARVCPVCGSEDEVQRAFDNKPAIMADVKRAAEMGADLGEESFTVSVARDVGNAGPLGCLLGPFFLLNPLFWLGLLYGSKAKTALRHGNLDLAQEYKDVSAKFNIAGWILVVVVFFIGYSLLRSAFAK